MGIKAIIIDIDGTITHMNQNDRSPYDFGEAVLKDVPNTKVIEEIKKKVKDEKLYPIFLTGRSEGKDKEFRQYTEKWLDKHVGFPVYSLFMRHGKDFRKSYITKKRLYEKYIQDKYDVVIVYEDEDQNTEMFRNDLNLNVIQIKG